MTLDKHLHTPNIHLFRGLLTFCIPSSMGASVRVAFQPIAATIGLSRENDHSHVWSDSNDRVEPDKRDIVIPQGEA